MYYYVLKNQLRNKKGKTKFKLCMFNKMKMQSQNNIANYFVSD